MKVCLVAVAIGDKYLERYNTLFRPSQEQYASKHGYDFRVETEYLDPRFQNKAVCSLNKILVSCQPWSYQYDFVIFIDSDIVVNISSPPIHSCMDFEGKIGIVNEYDQLVGHEKFTDKVRESLKWGTASEYYEKAGFYLSTELMLNTGVLVMQPALHGEFLRNIFDLHVETCLTHPRGFHYEQAAIGYHLQTSNMFKILPKEFNAIWIIRKIIYHYMNYYEALEILNVGINKIIKRKVQNKRLETEYEIVNRIWNYFRENFFIHLASTQNYERIPELMQINTELSNNEDQSKGRS